MILLICLIFSTHTARGKNKNMIRPLARIFKGASCTIAARNALAGWKLKVPRACIACELLRAYICMVHMRMCRAHTAAAAKAKTVSARAVSADTAVNASSNTYFAIDGAHFEEIYNDTVGTCNAPPTTNLLQALQRTERSTRTVHCLI